jgi:two-component SAPR family response regulator
MTKSIIEQLQEAANNPTELDKSLLTTKTDLKQIHQALNRLNLAKTDLDNDTTYQNRLRDAFNCLNIDNNDLARTLSTSNSTLTRYRKSISAPQPEKKLMHYNAIGRLYRTEIARHNFLDI